MRIIGLTTRSATSRTGLVASVAALIAAAALAVPGTDAAAAGTAPAGPAASVSAASVDLAAAVVELYDGDRALGVLSGGTTGAPCHSYFQPVTEVLAAYGLSL
jgi:hypothetical protein